MYYSLQVIFGVDGHLIRHRDDAVEEVTESQVYDEDSVGSCHLEVVKVVTVVRVAIRVFHITPFFELSLVLLTTHAIGLYEVTKKISAL